MSHWTIKFYANSRGDKPVENFINKLDKPTLSKILRILDQLEEYGPDLRMPFTKYMLENIYELRVRGKNELRIFYIFSDGKTIYLLHVFKKKTQKTPSKELDIAVKRKNELTSL